MGTLINLLPNGYATYLGSTITAVTAVLAVLTALQGGDLNLVAQRIAELIALFSAGHALATAGLRRAIANGGKVKL